MRTLKRDEAIRDIRREVLKLVDDEHSVCEVCTRLDIMCRGFRQFSDEELARRYKWIAERGEPKTRAELEELANRWQLARQLATGRELACDVQLEDRDTCDGWDTFTTTELARYYKQLTGEDVEVADDLAVHYRTFSRA
jgi:hypothetical protein